MDLLVQTLLITLVAAFGFAHDGVGSTMWNRPIVMAPLVGLVLGDIRTGIMTGATLELIWLGAFPVGASCPPEMVSGAIIGTSFVINSGGEPSARGVERTETIGWIFEIVSLSAIIAVSYYLGAPLIKDIVAAIPPFINHGLEIATGIIPAIGFAMLVRMIISKDVAAFFFGGFLLSAYLEIPVFGVALMACVIVGVILTIKQTNNNKISEEVLSDENEF